MGSKERSPVLSSLIILFLLIGLNVNSHSQEYNRANIWYFGNEAGIDFNTGEPVPLYDNRLISSAWRGTTVMSDTNGSMLFYTHGLRVCNQIHGFMSGPIFMDGSMDVITFPAPGSNNLYYIFSVPGYLPTASYTLNFYSIVDMTLNGGLGDVTEPIEIPGAYGADQKLTAVKHKNKKDVWVVFRLLQHEKYASYLVTENGLNPQAVLSPAPDYEDFSTLQLKGQIRISYDKKYLILANAGGVYNNEERDILEINKFDPESGEVDYLYSMQIRDDTLSSSLFQSGGIEFSPDSKFAYFSVFIAGADSGLIYQYDMQFVEDSASFNQSKELIGIGTRLMGLQLARDGKIYCTGNYGGGGGRPYISLIHKPWEKGISCDFQKEAVYLTPGGGEGKLTNILLDYLYRFDYKGVCEGDTFQFDPWFIPEPTYIEWNFGDPLSGMTNISTIPHATHKFTNGGTYEVSVYVEYPSGRIEETSREVEVEYAPEPDLGPDTTMCTNADIILNAECGPHFYSWSTGAIGSSQITVSDTGWYWVRVENDAGCFEIDSIHIGLFPPAIADTTNLEIIPTTCGGSTGVIKGLLINGLPPLSWQWLDDLGDTISTSLDIYHLPVGNYTLQVSDGNNCTTDIGPYSIYDAGDVLIEDVSYTQEHCQQQDASITVTAISGLGDMLFYSIDNGANYYPNQGIFTALSAGSYAVRVRDSSDCQSVYINNPIIIQNIDAPEIINVQIGASSVGQSTGSIEITALGSSDTLFYSNDNGANYQINDGGFYNLAAGFYTCVVVDEIGCDTSFIVEVPEEVTIRLQAVAGEDEACPGNAAYVPLFVSNFNDVAYFKTTLLYNKDFLTCTGFANAHVLLEDSLQALLFPSEGKIELLWSSDAIDLPDNTPIADLVFQTIDPGLSLVEWDGSAGASLFQNSTGLTIPVDYFTGNVKIYNEVTILLSSSEEICQGESLEIEPWILSSNGDVSYLWTYPNGDTSDSETLSFNNIQEGHSGIYSLIVSDTLDCQSEASVDVIVHPLPIPDFSGQDTIITEEPVEIDAGANYASYLWNTGESTQWITASFDGWYAVIIESQQGCMGEDSVYVLFFIPPEPPEPPEPIVENFYVPNAFSPDGDGLNDELKAISNTENISSFHMYIYNRWGALVFESKKISLGWDGTYKGKPAPQGVYVYKIEYFIGTSPQQESRLMSGTVMLVR